MPPRPNVLLVLFDSLSADALIAHADHLPTLTGLRADSVYFEKAYACSPESGPARASLFTGLDMAAHGVWSDGVTLPARELTIAELFQRNGYHTWLVGRRHLAGVASWTTEHARPQEYHSFDWAHGPLHRSRQNAYLTWLQAEAPKAYAAIFPAQANPDDTNIPPWQRQAMADLPDAHCFNSWVGSQVRQRLSEVTDAPCFGTASFVVGATGGAPDEQGACFERLDARALFQADAALGLILNDLPANTIVALCAGRGNNRTAHVPLSLRIPNEPGKSCAGIVSTMDVAPTLYDAAGLVRPHRIQGQNLLTDPARGWAFTRLRHPDLPHETTLTTDQWRIVMTQSAGAQTYHLYDLQADPTALHDLADKPKHAETLEHMIDLMIDTRVALEDRTEPRIANF